MNDAKERANETLEKLNREVFNPSGLRIELEYGCSTSWVALRLILASDLQRIKGALRSLLIRVRIPFYNY